MELTITQEGERAKFVVAGKIDESGSEILKRRFRELNMSSLKELTLDFGKVSHIGSAGIGKLLLFYKDLALRGGEIRIENMSEAVSELFKMLKLDTIFIMSR